ncbi:type II toxin-antitoxin system prevent-host-death family antitoxin [Pelodictyon phaeoclathratiforme]|uniref:type II toxin-antitoxin system prevent-host-death family antitoxin n=1 Tax=Pelodictyon phaeoclathratiforme TaxID=34090 RepID=UPI001CBAA05B|nr:type II toxin-antitoxin system prevent-host-death family antitoxin [Pelodictyon phaeoclathratiforme]
MRATAKELKFNSKKLIYSVNRGEGVIITFRGKPCAKLFPYQEIKKQTEKNELFSHSMQLADALIGATAIAHGLPVLTGNDKHYKCNEGSSDQEVCAIATWKLQRVGSLFDGVGV